MKKVGRNELCPCGSGKKFKRCHLGVNEIDEDNMEDFVKTYKQLNKERRINNAYIQKNLNAVIK